MSQINSLSDIISFNEGFKSAINLYLNLNKKDKVLGYIPTKSSVAFLKDYLYAIKNNKEQATILVGPYGKGKSHLLLVLLAIASMERSLENQAIVNQLINKIRRVEEIGEETSILIEDIWNTKGKFLPVLISNTQGELNQAFLYSLSEALKREGISELIPDTYYSIAVQRIESWEKEYPDTYRVLEDTLKEYGKDAYSLKNGLLTFSKSDLATFIEVYPKMTSGSVFNPLAVSDVFPLYKSVSEKLVDEYDYSGIYIVFDEFSKFIESQDVNSAGNNMKLLQEICELAKESDEAQIYITMVAHKSIKEYGKHLSNEIINSFTGIEGRIQERYFITSSKNNYELVKNAIIKEDERLADIPQSDTYFGKEKVKAYYKIPFFKSNFNESDFEKIVLRGCFPLNPISAYLLLNVSEKVAQNERTLFTFVSNDEPNSMARFVMSHNADMEWGVGADLVYDYFAGLFKKEVINEHVHNEWLNAEYALAKCKLEQERRFIKALAIVLIVNREDEMPADEKIVALSLGFDNMSEIVQGLIDMQLVYKKGSTNYLTFKTRAGSALKTEIKRQRSIKGGNANYSRVLENVSQKYYVMPRKYNVDNKMTRYFRHEYMRVNDFLAIDDSYVLFDSSEYTDGKVISLYSVDKIDLPLVRKHIKKLGCKKLVVVCPNKVFDKKQQVIDYEILQDLRNSNTFIDDNEVLKREIPLLEEDLSQEIEMHLRSIYEEDNECCTLFLNNGSLTKYKAVEVEKAVNVCCEQLYCKTPIINNEMVNRHEINTGQTKKARLNIIQAILDHKDTEDFYEGTNQEATIYRALFCRTGIIAQTQSETFKEIFDIITEFLESCSEKKQSMTALIELLTKEPYGMRKAVIPLYLSYLLVQRNEDIIIYFADMEIQLKADIVVNMCEKADDYALYISKADLQKEKYIDSLKILFQVDENRNLSENRIKNIFICMQRWFRALPQVTRNAVEWEDYHLESDIKEELLILKKFFQKVDINPFEVLFVKMPELFNCVGEFARCFELIDKCKTAFDDYYDWIVNKAVEGTAAVFGSRGGKDLYHVVKEWYGNQSDISKNGLHSGRITNFMSCLEKLNVFDNAEVTKRIIKSVTDVYVEDWGDGAYDVYIDNLKALKTEIERIQEESTEGKLKLSFTGKNGKYVEKYYEKATEDSGTVLKNILEDALDEYSDLSVNDRVAILLEMIEKVIG